MCFRGFVIEFKKVEVCLSLIFEGGECLIFEDFFVTVIKESG